MEEELNLMEDSMTLVSINGSLDSDETKPKRPKRYLKMRKLKKVDANKSYQKLAKEKKKKKELINESRQNLSSFITKSIIEAPPKPKPVVTFQEESRISFQREILSKFE